MVVSSAAHHRLPRARPTSSSVPGAAAPSGRARGRSATPPAPSAAPRDGPRCPRGRPARPAERRQVGRHGAGRLGRRQLGVHGRAPALDGLGDDAEPEPVAPHRAEVRWWPGIRVDRSRAARSGSASFISCGADGPFTEMLAPRAATRSRSRCSAQGGWKSRYSGRDWSTRARRTAGSTNATSTFRAPSAYAARVSARISSRCAGSPCTASRSSGRTAIQERTIAVAYRARIRSSSIGPQLTLAPCIATTTRPRSSRRRSWRTPGTGFPLDPVAARRPEAAGGARPPAGQTITEDGLGGQAALRSSPRCSRRPASRSTTRGSCRSSRPRRPRRPSLFDLVVRRVVDLRRIVAGGSRRGLRREPGTALDGRPRRVAGRGARRVRLRRAPGSRRRAKQVNSNNDVLLAPASRSGRAVPRRAPPETTGSQARGRTAAPSRSRGRRRRRIPARRDAARERQVLALVVRQRLVRPSRRSRTRAAARGRQPPPRAAARRARGRRGHRGY